MGKPTQQKFVLTHSCPDLGTYHLFAARGGASVVLDVSTKAAKKAKEPKSAPPSKKHFPMYVLS
eukprot:12179604-Alexandrium_andersonii.AAC.1